MKKVLTLCAFLLCSSGSFCMAKQLFMITPPVQVAVGDNVVCAIVNISDAPIIVTMRMFNDVGVLVQSQSDVTIPANQEAAIFFVATLNNFWCRFDGVKTTKARAAMNILDTTGKPYISLPAN